MPKMRDSRNVLLLSSDERETAIFREMLSRHTVQIANARNLPEMLRLLGDGPYDAFFCDWHFEGGTWRDALGEIRSCAPQLPTIVVCPVGGECEWLEVLEAGAFDLLATPWRELSVVAVLEHALDSRDARAMGSVA